MSAAPERYLPDHVSAIVGYEEPAVVRHRNPDRASPDVTVAGDEAGHEVLVLARGLAVPDRYANHFVTGPLLAIPRAVLGREGVGSILRRELVPRVESHFQRGRMRLHEHVRRHHSVAKLWMCAWMSRILRGTEVEPRPAVEGTFADARHVVGNEIVAQPIPLVDGGPQFPCLRVHRDSDGVADSRGIHAGRSSVRIVLEDVGAPGLVDR